MTSIVDRPDLEVDPGDRWSAGSRVVHLSGVQATIRLLIDTLRADREAGHRTAAFVSGYQGSPLAGFDKELQHALGESVGVEIVHRPAVNEELGATAVMGSQLAPGLDSSRRLDGVLGVWYGKAPGLDRSVDALRHANYAGASRLGGAIALVGDDPGAKSSTLPSASESVLADLAMPILFPRSLDDVIKLGRHAVNLSRWSGSWVALKLVTSVADAEGTVRLTPFAPPVLPDGYEAAAVTGDLLTPATVEREPLVLTERLVAAARYGDANHLNRLTVQPGRAVVTLVAAGTVYSELVEAMGLLGLDAAAAQRLGIRVAEVRMPYPIGAAFALEVGDGVEEVVVVEERRELVESQLLSLLARRPGHPTVVGRLDEHGRALVPRHGSLDAPTIARLLRPRLVARFGDAVGSIPEPRRLLPLTTDASRVPWFCSGCPHSASTVVPEGTLVGVGIGCHSIVTWMPESRVGHSIGNTQMGGEGAQWIGMAPFVETHHIVANLGDGTFFHSGQLAVRAAVAAGVAITYKLLWNGVSAMTGGQHVAGVAQSPLQLADMLLLEGVERVVITTDDRSGYRGRSLPSGVSVRPREEILAVQEELARVDGVTVMIHDQACATELRRARKRGKAAQPGYAVVINERVCEGCGDCQVKSNCLSLQTVDTPFGQKTRIDPATCNVDLSCLQGDCPAFTLVKDEPVEEMAGKDLPSRRPAPLGVPTTSAPPPGTVSDPGHVSTIRVVGIGGTGIVTTAHLLAWAAQLDGLDAWGLDQTGLSQKAGPVISDVRIGPGASERSNVVEEGDVDLLLAPDLLTAALPAVLHGLSPTRSSVVGSTSSVLSGPMVLGRQDRRLPTAQLQEAISNSARPGAARFVDAIALAVSSGGTGSVANVVLLGVASQLGYLPVSVGALTTAIRRNGTAVEANLAAFAAGRAWVVDGAYDGLSPAAPVPASALVAADLPGAHRVRIGMLADDLVGYQHRRLARRFLDLVGEVWEVERAAGGDGALAAAVAGGYHRLLAYKDEYETARLLLEYPQAPGHTTWLLHPPVLRARGLGHKIHLGPWATPAMRALRLARPLRGTPLDLFGRTPMRREERQLPVDYAATMRSLLPMVEARTLDEVTAIAGLPQQVRGFEAVKQRSLVGYRAELAARVAALRPPR